MVCETYDIENSIGRILVISKLKGRAYEWFHARPEHFELTLDDLLSELGRVFHHRRYKLDWRREL